MFYIGKRSGENFKICDFKINFLKIISYETIPSIDSIRINRHTDDNASLSRGFIGSVCNLQKYSFAWVLI